MIDGAFTAWLRGVGAELRWPWAFLTVDLTKKPTRPAPDDFERIRALARSSLPGCRAARKALRAATLRGLAKSVGRDPSFIINTVEKAR